ncbi:hypothetical protein AbraIFM66951_010675 [Aspergillus brasiliensis]|nr:hypothetical protein AbraIFM66951_010675 [Aspergillus brasiliensis]
MTRIETVVLDNRRSTLEAYLDAGIDPNMLAARHGFVSLLFLAATSNHSDIVELLLNRWANPRQNYGCCPSDWSILDQLGWYYQAHRPGENWEKTALTFLERGASFSSLGMAEQLCSMPNASHVLEVAIGNGLDIRRTFTEDGEYTFEPGTERVGVSFLHIAAAKGTPDLMKTILDHAPELTNVCVTVVYPNNPPPLMLWHHLQSYKVLCQRSTTQHHPPLDAAVERGDARNVGYLLERGSEATFLSLEGAIKVSNTKPNTWHVEDIEEPADSVEWLAWKVQWADYVQIIAGKLDLDSKEAALSLERILAYASWWARNGDGDDGRLYLPGLLSKMSLRNRLHYTRRLELESYVQSLTAARKKIKELEGQLELENKRKRLKPNRRLAGRNTLFRDRSITSEKLEYVGKEVEGLEQILELRREAPLFSI